MGDVLKAYFVPNGSYLMEMAEDGDAVSAVVALQDIGREIRSTLRPDAIVVASPHWLPKSAFFVDDGERHESFNDYPLRPAPFGRRFFSYTAAGDPALARAIVDAAREAGLAAATKNYGFDHGAFGMPPLHLKKLRGFTRGNIRHLTSQARRCPKPSPPRAPAAPAPPPQWRPARRAPPS